MSKFQTYRVRISPYYVFTAYGMASKADARAEAWNEIKDGHHYGWKSEQQFMKESECITLDEYNVAKLRGK